jgi:hypothetical protein
MAELPLLWRKEWAEFGQIGATAVGFSLAEQVPQLLICLIGNACHSLVNVALPRI